MYIEEIKNWFGQNPGVVQFIQFIVPITISLLSIKYIKIKKREPILILDIKNIKEFSRNQRQKIKDEEYLIANSDYILQIRNEGDGVALNTYVESDNFKVVKCQNYQIGIQEEQFIKIVKKPDDEIKSLGELNGEIVKIYCETLKGIGFYFKYQIIDMKDKRVRFLSKGYGKTEESKGNFHIDH